MLEGLILGAHLMSYHDSGHFNNVNPGLYLHLESGITAGTYYNSERRQSQYAGYTFKPFDALPHLDVTVGAVTGYKRKRVSPLFIPSYTAFQTEEGWRGRIGLLPRMGSVQPVNVVHFMLEKQF